MKSLEQKVENQVQFWSLLGPFLLLLTIAVLLFKLSAHWYFPVSAMIGIPLCVKWKLKGLAAALSCLFLLSLFSYQYLELDQRYWHVGMAIAMAFSFVILTLSLEEVESLVDKMQRESQSRLDNFLLLDEATKRAEEAWSAERSTMSSQLAVISQELTQVQEEKQVFYKLAQLAKDELLQMRTQQELLQQDLLYKKQQISQLNEKLEGSEITLQELINSDSEQKVIELSKSLDESLQCQAECLEELELCQKQLEKAYSEKEMLERQLRNQEDRHKEDAAAFLQVRVEKDQLLESLKEKIEWFEVNLANSNEDLTSKNEALVKADEASKRVINKLEHARERLKTVSDENEQLRSAQDDLKKELECKKIELIRSQNQLVNFVECQESREGKPFDGNTRRIECMYDQLKNQFQEKSTVLDQTRRELFMAEEKALIMQKKLEELELYSQSEMESLLLTNFKSLIKEFDKIQNDYESEIEMMQEIVSKLFRRL